MTLRPTRIPVFDVFDFDEDGHVPVYDAGLHRFIDGGVPSSGGGSTVTGLVAGDNGTHAVANLAALQAALDAAEAAGGGRVTLPVGIYQFSGTANIGSRVTYAGIPSWPCIHKLANGAATVATPQAVLAAKGNSNYISIEDLYIDGNAANQTDSTYSSPGIDFYSRGTTETSSPPLYDGGLRLHRVMVYNCKGVGFYVRGDATTMQVSYCYAYHNQSEGFWLKSDFEITNCVAANNGGEGFRVYSGTSGRLTACKGFGNGSRYDASDFLIHYSEAVTMSDCQAEDSRWRGFTFTSVRFFSGSNLAAYRCNPEQAESSAFWIEDDASGGICSHFYLEGAVRAGGGGGAFAHALTTRELGEQVEIRLKTNSEFTGTKWRHISGSLADSVVSLDNASAGSIRRNRQTGDSYTLALQDVGGAVEMSNGSANTVTFPPNTDVAIPVEAVGTVAQYGAGLTTLAAGAGVTVRSRGGLLASAGQYAVMSWQKIGTNEFWITGDLA